MGMLATVMNCLALQDVLQQQGVEAKVLTAMEIQHIGEPFSVEKADEYLRSGKVVVFGGGVGSPFFTTDTGAVLRAALIGADAVLLAKNVDGVYSADPVKDPNAVRFDSLTYEEVLEKASRGHGQHGDVHCHGQPHPHQGVRPARTGKHPARRPRRDRRHAGPLKEKRKNNTGRIHKMAEIKEFKNRMIKTAEVLSTQFDTVRAGRANASVLDQIEVEYYGSPTPIRQIASISSPDARTLLIQPWDGSTLKLIEKAILASDLGINPQNDGRMLRLVFPPLTEERRKELAKQVRKYGEEAKVAVRNIRRDAMDKFKKEQKKGEITEDDLKDLEKDIQKLTDDYTKEVDKLTAAKEKELFEI